MSKFTPVLCYTALPWEDLGKAAAVFDALRRFHPDWRYVAVIEDTDPPAEKDAGFEIVAGDRVSFMHQACHEAAVGIVVHIDSHAVVTAALDPLLAHLEGADILLLARMDTPSADRQAVIERDLHIARSGTFNLGILALRTTESGPAFAAWWADRVRNYPADIAPPGYAEQRWLDLAPGLFDGVTIVRQAPMGLELPRDR